MTRLHDLTRTNATHEALRQFHHGGEQLLPGALVGATGDALHESDLEHAAGSLRLLLSDALPFLCACDTSEFRQLLR